MSAQSFIDAYKTWDVTQMVSFLTRFRGELLDLFFVKDKNSISNIQDLPPLGRSDHVVVRGDAQFRVQPKPTLKIIKRNFWSADYDVVSKYISDRLEENTDINTYQECSCQTIEQKIPVKIQRVNFQKP